MELLKESHGIVADLTELLENLRDDGNQRVGRVETKKEEARGEHTNYNERKGGCGHKSNERSEG